MKESNFAGEIKRACQIFKSYYYKIPDSFAEMPDKNKKGKDGKPKNIRFQIKRPFDAFMYRDGQFVAMEFKMHKTTGAFSFGDVKEHQVQGLLDVKKGGGSAYVLVNLRRDKFNKAYYIDIDEFIKQKELHLLNSRKSIRLEDLEATWTELTRTSRDLKGGIAWDMENAMRKI